jgi:hypothetical protein
VHERALANAHPAIAERHQPAAQFVARELPGEQTVAERIQHPHVPREHRDAADDGADLAVRFTSAYRRRCRGNSRRCVDRARRARPSSTAFRSVLKSLCRSDDQRRHTSRRAAKNDPLSPTSVLTRVSSRRSHIS